MRAVKLTKFALKVLYHEVEARDIESGESLPPHLTTRDQLSSF